MILNVLGTDPTLTNFGMVHMTYDTASAKLHVLRMELVVTERKVTKSIRQNSDDLRRAEELNLRFHHACKGKNMVFSEIPTGSQSARANLSFGVVIGLLAGCPVPLIQIQPSETKLAAVGTKTASKEEMIEWAVEKYPNLNWHRRKSKGNLVLMNSNEHLADAIAVVHAGVNTDEFKRGLMLWNAAEAA